MIRDVHRHIVGLMQRMLDRLADERAKDQPEPAVPAP